MVTLNWDAPGLCGRDDSQVLRVSNCSERKEWRKNSSCFLFSEKELTELLDAANSCLLDASRQQLVQLVLDTPLISSPLACSRRAIGKSHAKTSTSSPVVKEEVPVIDSLLKKENVCTLTKTDGLAGTDWKVCKTEEHRNISSSSPGAASKDNKAGPRGSPEGTNSGEKPSTSVVKIVNKGEILNFCFCSDHFPKSVVASG